MTECIYIFIETEKLAKCACWTIIALLHNQFFIAETLILQYNFGSSIMSYKLALLNTGHYK